MEKKEIILIGGGGHCKSCIDVIESENKFIIAGIIDTKENIGKSILGYTILGCDDDLEELKKKYDFALITVGQIKSSALRKKLYNKTKELGYKFPVILASTAYISKHSKIGTGTIIMHQAIVNSNTTIGENNIINSKALIEHDCAIGDNNHLSTGTILNGSVTILNDNFIGSGTVINHGIKIANEAVISSGSIIRKSITEKGTYYGNTIQK